MRVLDEMWLAMRTLHCVQGESVVLWLAMRIRVSESEWCPGEDLNLHDLAVTSPSS